VAVRRAHHRNLDALIAKSRDTSGPFSFERGPPFEIKAELAKEVDGRFEVIDDDAYVVHPFERHLCNLQGDVSSDNGGELFRSRVIARLPSPLMAIIPVGTNAAENQDAQ